MEPYVKQFWVNGPSGETALNATRLNHIEDGLEEVSLEVATRLSPDVLTAAINAAAIAASNQVLIAHIEDETPHAVYDDAPSLTTLFENGLV